MSSDSRIAAALVSALILSVVPAQAQPPEAAALAGLSHDAGCATSSPSVRCSSPNSPPLSTPSRAPSSR